ncbi:MAG: hypothetical protein DI539_27135, partial [Flavobacterium psychrophilum]
LAEQINQMFVDNNFPLELTNSRTILLHKKGDPHDIGNYRHISLLTTTYKVLTRVLTKRIQDQIGNQIPAEQAGFRQKFSTVDHIMSLNLLFEKAREWKLPIYATFIDFQKAFDTVQFEAIWAALRHYKLDDCTIRMIQQLYVAGKSSVVVGNSLAPYSTQRGVRQGDSLSPLLFIITLQYALDQLKWDSFGIKIGTKRLQYLAYADDIVLLSSNKQELQQMLNELATVCAKAGLQINVAKTKAMSTLKDPINLQVNNINIEQVENFTYLGQLITQPRDQKREIGKRIACAWASFNKAKSLLTNRLVSMDTKRRYVQMCVVPALLYGCETWALTKANENRLARCQRAMERRILNIRLINKHPNKWIRQQTGQKDFVEAYRTRKWKHLHKMLSRGERWDKQLLDWTPAEKRPLGRPPTRWQDDFKKVAGSMWKQKAAQTTWLKEASAFAIRQR